MMDSQNERKSYFGEGQWYKGNLHCHSTITDGSISPEDLLRKYWEKGYDFLSVTDHNIFGIPAVSKDIPIIMIPGVEHDLAFSEAKCVHLVGTRINNNATNYDCRRYTPMEMNSQQMAEMMLQDGQFVVLAHPIWSRMEADEVLSIKGIQGIEVYNNGTEHLCHAGNAAVYWDLLLRNNRRVFGLACDDTHKEHDLFGGWICVKAKKRSPHDIFDAITSGQFYSSSGPTIIDFGLNGREVYLSCSDCREIHFISYPSRGKSFFATDGNMLNDATCMIKGNELYIRAECVDASGHIAWTNPIFFDD